MNFPLLLLGSRAEVTTHIQCLECSAHSGEHPSSPNLCSPQSPAASVEDVGWPERGSEVSQWERDTAPCLPPETLHCEGTAAVFQREGSLWKQLGPPIPCMRALPSRRTLQKY